MKTLKRYIVVDKSYDLDEIYCNVIYNTNFFTNKRLANKSKNLSNKYAKKNKYTVVKILITIE